MLLSRRRHCCSLELQDVEPSGWCQVYWAWWDVTGHWRKYLELEWSLTLSTSLAACPSVGYLNTVKRKHKKVCLPLRLIFIMFHLYNLCLTRRDSYFSYSMATLLPMCLDPLSQEDQGDHANRGCAPNSEPAENVLNVSWSQGFPSSWHNYCQVTKINKRWETAFEWV